MIQVTQHRLHNNKSRIGHLLYRRRLKNNQHIYTYASCSWRLLPPRQFIFIPIDVYLIEYRVAWHVTASLYFVHCTTDVLEMYGNNAMPFNYISF